MGAFLVHDSDRAGCGAERDQVFAKEANTQRCPVTLRQFCRDERRDPILTEEASHGGAGTYSREEFIVITVQHSWATMGSFACKTNTSFAFQMGPIAPSPPLHSQNPERTP